MHVCVCACMHGWMDVQFPIKKYIHMLIAKRFGLLIGIIYVYICFVFAWTDINR
jgi:hypothetical protein